MSIIIISLFKKLWKNYLKEKSYENQELHTETMSTSIDSNNLNYTADLSRYITIILAHLIN